jgi:hypothetical protein
VLPENGRKSYLYQHEDLLAFSHGLHGDDGKADFPDLDYESRVELMCRYVDSIASPAVRKQKTFITEKEMRNSQRLPLPKLIVTGKKSWG